MPRQDSGKRLAYLIDPITEIRLVNQLAASQVKLGHESEATAVVTCTRGGLAGRECPQSSLTAESVHGQANRSLVGVCSRDSLS